MRRFALASVLVLLSSSVALAGNQTAGDDDMNAPPPAPPIVVQPPPPPPPPTYPVYPAPQPYNPYNQYNPYNPYPPYNPYNRYPVAPVTRPAQPPRRVFGLGSSIAAGSVTSEAGGRADLGILGDLWIEIPLSHKAQLELWVPVLNMLAAERGTLVLWGDVFYKRYLGGDGGGFFIAPGLGFVHHDDGFSRTTALEIPARIGYEFSTRNRSFGFTVAGRPWVDIWFGEDGRTQAGWGGLFELTFTGYWTRPQ